MPGKASPLDSVELSGGRLNLRPSTLYAALDRLTEDGLLAVERTEADRGRLRRYYMLTEAGTALVTPRYANRKSTARHPRPMVLTDTTGLDRSDRHKISSRVVKPAVTRADFISGTRNPAGAP